MDLNPYEELGVARDANEKEVRQAYRSRAKTAHPDRGGDSSEWERACTSLAVLTDPKKRKTYDDTGRIEEDRPDNDRAVALQTIDMHMGQIINRFITGGFDPALDPRRGDALILIKIAISGEIAQAEDGIKGGENVLKFMRDMAKRFVRSAGSTPDDDPIGRGLDRQIKSAEQQLADIKACVRQRQLALSILDGYQFQTDTPADAYHRGQTTPYSWSIDPDAVRRW